MNEKINEMLEMQKALDEYITKNNGITKIEKSRLQMALIDEIGELDRYELFDIAQVLAGGNEAYSTIRVKQMADGAVELTHVFTDATIRVNESEKKKYLKYIEDTYMQGMDADTWLGFEEALEKQN